MVRLRNARQLVVAAALALGVTGAARAAEVEAKKDGVEVRADASTKADVLGTLKAGESVPAIERKGMFWQVKYNDKTGFVSALAVTHKPDAAGGLAKAIKDAVKDGRASDDSTEGRQRSAVMGVRGLAPDDDMANAGDVRPNLRAVYKMEDERVAQKKVDDLGEKVLDEVAHNAQRK
jgi:hypothetical protein